MDVAFYTFVLFITTYVATYLELPRNYALNAVLIAAAIQVFAIPFFGGLSDRIAPAPRLPGRGDRGRHLGLRVLRPAGHRQFVLIVLAAVVALIFHAAMYGPQAAFIAEMFPTKVRYTGASMGYQLAGIVGGALAPIISFALLGRFDTSIAVSVYGSPCSWSPSPVSCWPRKRPASTCTPTPPRKSRPLAGPRKGGGMPTIDLNSDLGEGFGIWSLGDDEALLDVVTSANVACGFHAGDPEHPPPGL